jgi:tRNA U34 5-methylaminomethyl-2-thiouridine-forming methyltransferase MnmC
VTDARTWIETPTADGSWTLVHAELGEGCHSLAGAWQQATQRYAAPCRIAERARVAGRVRLLDIGTGLGLNLAAARAAAGEAELEVVTHERDPEVLAAGRALYQRPELAGGPWSAPHRLVRASLCAALDAPGRAVPFGRGTLELCLGDARATLPADRRFDAIFLDPFSPARAGELWEPDFLARVAAALAPEGWLSTYSASFRVRLALAAGGLEVGLGPRVGAKGEGTLARRDGSVPPLAPRVSARLARRLATLRASPAGGN